MPTQGKPRNILLLICLLVSFSLLVSCGGEADIEEELPDASAEVEQLAEGEVAESPDEAEVPAEPGEAEPSTPADTSSASLVPVEGKDVDLGFRPEVNGFSFENYGSDQAVTNLTPVEMQRMFGNQVCASLEGDTCTLTPPAEQWMEQNNASMEGGHCEGFAVLSLLMYSGTVDPAQFGGSTASELELDGNEPLQREIAYWFTTQGTTPARNALIQGTPAEIVAYLQKAYQPGSNSETYAVGIYKPDFSGGHAITAYAVRDQGDGVFWIMVYDNNYPGEERYITVDTGANTWQYEASINPEVEPDLYQGDASTNTLEIMSSSSRMGEQDCDFCSEGVGATGQAAGKLAAQTPNYNQVWMEGDAAFLITDNQGRKLGFDGTTYVNQIPEARAEYIKGSDLAKQDVPPVYEMPVGMEFNLLIDGDTIKNTETNATDVVMIGPGYYIGVENIYMDPGQKDIIKMAGDGKSIAYKTDYSESPDIIVGIERTDADFELDVYGKDIKPGTETIVQFDQGQSVLALRSTSDEDGAFYIAITRIDDQGEETFESGDEDIVLQPGDIIYFDVARWDGQGKSLEIRFDDGGDGTIDETLNMDDAK